jgi:hypothetical protein
MGNHQNPLIEEGQTTQWPQDTKGVIRIRQSQKDRQHNDQDTKGVIRIRKSQKDRQHNGPDTKGVIRIRQ